MKNSTVSTVFDLLFSDEISYNDALETVTLFADTCAEQGLGHYALASIGDDRGTARDILAGAGHFLEYGGHSPTEINTEWAIEGAIPAHRMTRTLKSDAVHLHLRELRDEA